jgi:uncharacterized membrane protein YobD (UPF0266 family)
MVLWAAGGGGKTVMMIKVMEAKKVSSAFFQLLVGVIAYRALTVHIFTWNTPL